ncbi:OmpW/AlkL family protein [Pseudoxanthomonas mexicana]|uniref:OmpW/AlkL family protein n=1 Tax=Pseudoxanthomonas mexicana TaxID=128785 RepID=UPI00398BB972
MSTTSRILIAGLSAALATVAAPAMAQSKGDLTLAIGAHQVAPKSNNGDLVVGRADVDNDIKPTLMLEYFIADNLGLEVIAAAPFKHDVSVGGAHIGSVKHLPPTISLQYHFNSAGKVSPFVGAGVNYTLFFSEDTSGVLGSDVSLKNSWGLAAHAGLDFKVGEKGAIRVDARWIDIDSDVSLGGTQLGTVNIDPLVYGAAYVLKF